MKFSNDDIHRSLRAYLALAVGQLDAAGNEWSLRTEREVLADNARPAMVVEFSTPVTLMAGAKPDRRTIPQGPVARMATFAVQAYPAIFDTAREGRVEADRVAQLLEDTITFGLVADAVAPATGTVEVGHPGAVPIHDYAGVPVSGAGRGAPAAVYGWATVMDHSVQAIQDPMDEKRWTVAMSLRLSWWRPGRVGPVAPTVGSIPAQFHP